MPDKISYSDAWRNFYNFTAQFGPHIQAITDALERAASVEKYLADTNSAVEARKAEIAALDAKINENKKALEAQGATFAANKQKANEEQQKAQKALADLERQRTSAAAQYEAFKTAITKEKLDLSTERDLAAKRLADVNAELASKTAQLSETQKRMSAASALLQAS